MVNLHRKLLPFLLLISLSLSASAVRAAKYPLDYRWQTLRLIDVEVHHPEGYEPYARYLAVRALVHLDSLQGWYGTRPPVTRIILNPGHDQGMAHVTVLPLRMVTSLVPAMDKGLRPQRGLYLDRVTAHELTHVIQLSTTSGVTTPLRRLFGDVIAPLGVAPGWILEGQAIWVESRAGGGRYHSPYHRLLFRAPLAEGKLWSLDQLAIPGTVAPIANRAYVGGAFLVGELSSELDGINRTTRWMENQAKYPGLQGVAFRKSFSGRTAQGEYTGLERRQRDKLRELMTVRSRAGYAVGARILARDRTSWRHPVWVDSARVVAWESGYDRPARLVEVTLAPEAVHPVGLNFQAYGARALTAFGEGVIAATIFRDRWSPDASEAVLLYVDEMGRSHHFAEKPLRGWAPAYSQAAGRLAYIARADDGALELRSFPLNRKGRVDGQPTVHLRSALGLLADPAWSPDGASLAFTADLGEGERVYLLHLASGDLRWLDVDRADHTWDPAFSPTGTLWVSSAVDGIYDLFEIDPVTGEAFRRTRCLTGAFEPAISPDGQRVAYSHYTSEGFSLALLDSARWAREPHRVSIKPVTVEELTRVDDTLDVPLLFGKAARYSALREAKPRTWLPVAGEEDEGFFGALAYGRDPLGLLTWHLRALRGVQSELSWLDGSMTYRGWPVDATLTLQGITDFQEWYEVDSSAVAQPPTYEEHSQWSRRWTGFGLLHQNFRRDRAAWRRSVTPFAGVVLRERFSLQRTDQGLEIVPVWFKGIRGGVDLLQWNSAPRDPVVRYLRRFALIAERDFPTDGFAASNLLESEALLHHPLHHKSVVLALRLRAQYQDGPVAFSRSSVMPRGYGVLKVRPAIDHAGRATLVTGEVHFPLAFPDRGLGMGWAFLSRVDASLFVDWMSGYGEGRTIADWIEKDSDRSYGAELGFGSWLFYGGPLQLRVGVAHRERYKDQVVFMRASVPGLFTSMNGYAVPFQ